MAHERINIREEFKIIPPWAWALAVVVFGGMLYVFLFVAFKHEPHPPPVPLQVLIGFLPGSVMAFLALLVGYVNRDAKRRGMSVALWTVLVIFIPNAIGFILYFLLRHPLALTCPQCRTSVDASFNFCPKCKFGLHPTCPECKHAITPGDKFCPYCARQLT